MGLKSSAVTFALSPNRPCTYHAEPNFKIPTQLNEGCLLAIYSSSMVQGRLPNLHLNPKLHSFMVRGRSCSHGGFVKSKDLHLWRRIFGAFRFISEDILIFVNIGPGIGIALFDYFQNVRISNADLTVIE